MNQHGDHVAATCHCCKHLDIDYEGDYSEYTPGAGTTIVCRKSKFYMSDSEIASANMHQILRQSETCDEFEGRPE